MALDTLDNVKLMLGVTGTDDDDLLNALRSAADEFIPRFCGRGFDGGTFTEDHPGGGRAAFLRNFPVASVTSVKVDALRQFGAETLLDPTRYYVHAGRGVVECLAGSFVPGRAGRPDDFPGAVRVVYEVESDCVPAAVCRAYAELIGHWFRQAKTAAATGQVNVSAAWDTGGTLLSSYPWGQAGGFKVPDGVLDLLRPYRDAAV